jgi:endonuclease/exonuclease/phosphatase (EEP) superfamily protein YafD
MSRFRVLQFNMQFGQVWDDANPDSAPIRIEKAVAEIVAHDADYILLQEVEHAQQNGRQVEPPPHFTKIAAALPGYDSYFSYPRSDPRELPFGIGLAIFSRTPLRDRERVEIPSPPVEFEFFGKRTTPTDRLMIGARTTRDGHELQLLNTHLLAFFMLGSSSSTHPSQRSQVAERAGRSSCATIVSGDFNVSQHETLVAQFAKRGFRTAQKDEMTWRRRPYVLDHVFYNDRLRCEGHRVLPTLASDHHVLLADFEFV